MAKKQIIDSIVKLYSKLGGNISDVLGTRSNVNFMGTGKSSEPFLDMDLNIEALGAISKSKALQELKSSVGFATADKLNDVQASKLLTNMMKMDEFYNPPAAPANITDLATRTGNLDQKGLASLRRMTDETADIDLPPPGSRGGPDDIAAPVEQGFEGFERTIRELAKSDPEIAAQYRTVMTNKGGTPAKRATAREFLVEALKKENPNQTGLSDVVSEIDVKYITEGGGGIGGDPLLLVEKYFGPRIKDLVPEGASSEEIAIFTQRVLNNVVDANGLRPTDPRFDRLTATFIDETQTFAEGGRAGFFGGGLGRLGKAGYQAIRKYGIEAEDITDLFKSLATDKSLVGKEKTEYFKMLNQVLKNPDDYPDGVREILMRLGKPVDFADGGRVAFQGGGMDAGAGSDFGKEDFGTTTTTTTTTNNNNNNNDNDNTPPIRINPVVENRDIPIIDKSIPTAVGLEALLADKGKFKAVFDAEEAVKDLDLGSGAMLSYDGSIGPIDVNAMTNLSGDKSLNLGYQTKGGTNIGLETDLDDNAMFKISKTFAKGGLAKILEV